MGDAACDLRFGKFIEGGRKGAREGEVEADEMGLRGERGGGPQGRGKGWKMVGGHGEMVDGR